jgi:hypothetical protein
MSLPAAGAWPASLARPRFTRDASVSESSKTTSSKQQLRPQECQHFTASAAIAAAHTAEVKQAAGHTMPRHMIGERIDSATSIVRRCAATVHIQD